jgi:hypothetical protein
VLTIIRLVQEQELEPLALVVRDEALVKKAEKAETLAKVL